MSFKILLPYISYKTNTTDPRITLKLSILLLWILKKLKKRKKSKLINNGLQAELTVIIPGKNTLICHSFIY